MSMKVVTKGQVLLSNEMQPGQRSHEMPHEKGVEKSLA